MAPLALAPAASSSALDLTGMNLALVVIGRRHRDRGARLRVHLPQRRSSPQTPAPTRCRRSAQPSRKGRKAYLARQFKTLSVFVVLVFGLLLLLPADTAGVRWGRSGFFVVGAALLGA